MVVRMRSTRSHTGNRRSHHALGAVRLSICKECGAKYVNHTMCANCGKYKGRIIVDMTAELARAQKKQNRGKAEGR